MSAFRVSMADMPDVMQQIADRVRGVAAEKRVHQEQVGQMLGLSRDSISKRMLGKTAFTAVELFTLATVWQVPVTRFFPEPSAVSRGVAA